MYATFEHSPISLHELIRSDHELIRSDHELIRSNHELIRSDHELIRSDTVGGIRTNSVILLRDANV